MRNVLRINNRGLDFLIRSVLAVIIGIGLALLINTRAVAGDVQFDVLKTKTDLYKDVTVTSTSDTDIYITHSRGMANAKISDLDAGTLWKLGLGPEPLDPGSPEAIAAAAAAKENKPKLPAALVKVFEAVSLPSTASEGQPQTMSSTGTLQQLPPIQINPTVVAIALVAALLIHLFFSFCLKLIVQKTGNEPGIMVWLPILQVLPMLRAAGISGWWALAMLIPFVNIAVQVYWCVKIVQARSKSVWVTIFLIVPFTSLFAFLYLAFSGIGEEEDSGDSGKLLLDPVATGA